MGNKRWWESTSAADDGEYEVVEQDADGDWIDRFSFDDYKADKGLSSTDAIWNRYGYSSSLPGRGTWRSALGRNTGLDYQTAKKIESAQRLVQGFVDTFALDNPLKARFADSTSAVGGDADAKDVVVSHRPLLDERLSEADAHRVMTAQAANAAAQARYGGEVSYNRQQAVYATMGSGNLIAREVSLILDAYRIDTSFRRDYPGYEDVYAPAQEYIARSLLGGRETFALEDFSGASIANAALNYAPFTDWTDRESEREWWADWADKYANGSTETFVQGVVEGVAHLNVPLPPPPPPQTAPSRAKDEGEGEGEGDGSEEESEGQGGGEAGDSESDVSGESEDAGESEESDGGASHDVPEPTSLPTSLGKGVSLAGLANGQTKDVDESEAERLAETASALAYGRDEKEIGEIYWTTNGFISGRLKPVKPESSANGYIRRAFTRSRTAHYNTERGHVTGRIDNRSLPRIASDDYRLFSKRVAPSETRYRVWLMVDNSGSMSGQPTRQTMSLAVSVALAVRHVPNVTLDVWAWTTGQRVTGSTFSAIRVYADGESISSISAIEQLAQGGTPDAQVLSWASREIRKQCRPDETPVILMASDGSGSLATEAYWRDDASRHDMKTRGYSQQQIDDEASRIGPDRVALARKAGVKVLSVAIGELHPQMQDLIYGKGNHLIWRGSIKAMAKPLGDLIARVASNRK